MAEVHARHGFHHDLGRLARRYFRGAGTLFAAGKEREIVLALTYIIVIFSILVQGLTVERMVRRVVKTAEH